jgi:hypothetical protein
MMIPSTKGHIGITAIFHQGPGTSLPASVMTTVLVASRHPKIDMTMAVFPAVPEALPLLNPISGSSENQVASIKQEDPNK